MKLLELKRKVFINMNMVCDSELKNTRGLLSHYAGDESRVHVVKIMSKHITNCEEIKEFVTTFMDAVDGDSIPMDKNSILFLKRKSEELRDTKDLLAMYNVSTDIH